MKILYSSYSLSSILILIFLVGCQNEESLIGENFLTTESHEVFKLSESLIDLSISSQLDENLNANGLYSLLGSHTDSDFGTTNASFCFQITLPNNEMDFDASEITNIELSIPYIGYYGDENAIFKLRLSTLKNVINPITEVEHFTNEGENFENEIEFPELNIDLSSIQENNQLNIALPITFGLTEILNLSSEQLTDNSSFTNAFPGFKLAAELITTNGSIIYLDTSSDEASLNINYNDSNGDGQTESFPIGPGIQLNHFSHNYNNSNLLNEQKADSLLFIQSMGGVFGEIDFSFLENLKDSGYIVNDAVLSLSAIIDEEANLPNGQLNLCDSTNCNNVDLLPLAQSSISDENIYEFNITGYIQDVLTNNRNPICRLYMHERNSNANRVVINNKSDNPIKLKLILIKG